MISINDPIFSAMSLADKKLMLGLVSEFNKSPTCGTYLSDFSGSGGKIKLSENGLPLGISEAASKTSFYDPVGNTIYIYGLISGAAILNNLVGVLDHEIVHGVNRVANQTFPGMSLNQYKEIYFQDEADAFASSV